MAARIPFTDPPQPAITSIPKSASPELPVHKLFNFNGGGMENLAMRRNGEILATREFPSAVLWLVDPSSIRPPLVIHNFTSLASTAGITELEEDMFYVAGTDAQNRKSVHLVDMRPFRALPNGYISIPPKIKEIGDLPSALVVNGMTHIQRSDHFVLIADSTLGAVWKFGVKTGKSELLIQDPSMKGPLNQPDYKGLGINGLRVHNRTLFYTNSGAQTMYKMPIHSDGTSAGKATLITSGLSCDDFAIDKWGIAYVASPANALIRVDTRTGKQLVVAGNFDDTQSNIVGGTSAQFGRGPNDGASIYITTNGGTYKEAPFRSQGISRVNVGDLVEAYKDPMSC